MPQKYGVKLQEGLKVLPQIAAIDVLQVALTGYMENNISWTVRNKQKF